MSTSQGTGRAPVRPANKPEAERTDGVDRYAARSMTVGENVALTIKLLVGAGLIGLVLWGIVAWKSGG